MRGWMGAGRRLEPASLRSFLTQRGKGARSHCPSPSMGKGGLGANMDRTSEFGQTLGPMSVNTFGRVLRFTTWGESHGPALGAVVDGCPPGLELDEATIQPFLDARKPGTSK